MGAGAVRRSYLPRLSSQRVGLEAEVAAVAAAARHEPPSVWKRHTYGVVESDADTSRTRDQSVPGGWQCPVSTYNVAAVQACPSIPSRFFIHFCTHPGYTRGRRTVSCVRRTWRSHTLRRLRCASTGGRGFLLRSRACAGLLFAFFYSLLSSRSRPTREVAG